MHAHMVTCMSSICTEIIQQPHHRCCAGSSASQALAYFFTGSFCLNASLQFGQVQAAISENLSVYLEDCK